MLLLQRVMEEVLECIDEYCTVNESEEVRHFPLEECSQHETDELEYPSLSDICSSPAAFPILADDKESCESHMQHTVMPTFQFVAAGDSDICVYDDCTSSIRSLSDVRNNSFHFYVDDNFTRGENLSTVMKCNDTDASNVGHSSSQTLQFVCDDKEQSETANTTFLSCTKDMSTSVSSLSLMASRVKALCKIITVGVDVNDIFTTALKSTNLTKQLRRQSPRLTRIYYCDLLVANVHISCGHGATKKAAKCCACLNAVALLQKPYLHLKENSQLENTLKLFGSDTPSLSESYDTVTKIDITGSDLCVPVLSVLNCSEQQMADLKNQQLVISLKHVISTVRKILRVLQTVKSNTKVVRIAARCAKMSVHFQIFAREQFCCSLYIGIVLIAFAEDRTRTAVRDSVCAAAVELFLKPCLHLEGSEHGGPIRLVGPYLFNRKPSRTLPSPQNDKNDEVDLVEACIVSEEKLPTCDSQNSVLSAAIKYPAVLLNPADFPAIMACFTHLSVKMKAVFSDTATEQSAATIMALALKTTNLPFCTLGTKLSERRGYRCDLRIASVFVASGEAAKRTDATNKAYVNAAEILQKPHLCLAVSHEKSTMLIGSDRAFAEVPSASEPQQTPEIAISSPTVIHPANQRAKVTEDHMYALVPHAQNSVLSGTNCNENCPFPDSSAEKVSTPVEKQKQNGDRFGNHAINVSTLPDQTHVNMAVAGNKPDIQTQKLDDSVSEQELSECGKTVVIARSCKDLSRLENRFRSLAHITKDICALFKDTMPVKDMVEMALHISSMCSNTNCVKLQNGRIYCRLLIDDVQVAAAEDYSRKSARIMVYNIAAKLLCMPYLCLEEKLDAVQLLGSEKPFADMLLIADEIKVSSSSSKGLSLNSGIDVADVEDKKDLHKPLPYTADLSKVANHLYGLACRVKAISESMPSEVQINNSIDLIQRAVGGRNFGLCFKCRLVWVVGVGYCCELFIDGVEIACGKHSQKKRAKLAAHDAAVELLKKPYLRLQEDPENNQSFKLIGSMQPFEGASSGDFVSLAMETVPEAKRDFCETQTSELTYSNVVGYEDPYDSMPPGILPSKQNDENDEVDSVEARFVSEEKLPACDSQNSVLSAAVNYPAVLLSPAAFPTILGRFTELSNKVRVLFSNTATMQSAAMIVPWALKATNLPFHILGTRLNERRGYRCDLEIMSLFVAQGVADKSISARNIACMNAAELLQKPYLRLDVSHKKSRMLVGSHKPFAEMLPASASETQQTAEIAISSPTVIDPVVDQKAEISKEHALVPNVQNSVLSDDCDEKYLFAAASIEKVSIPVKKQKQPGGSSKNLVINMSTLPEQPHDDVAGNKQDIQTQRLDDSVSEQKLSECTKTVVIARSSKDLSRLVNRFRSLAHITKEIRALFKDIRNGKDMVEMALHMSSMSLTIDCVKLENDHMCIRLLIDDVKVAVAEDCGYKSARLMACNVAVQLLCMPYLCLEEKHDTVRLLGSQEPFAEMLLKSDEIKVCSSSSRGTWLDRSTDAANLDGIIDTRRPLPCVADLSQLVIRLHGLACRAKALSESGVQINHAIHFIQRAVGGKQFGLRLKCSVVTVTQDDYFCELFIDSVQIACVRYFQRKQAIHAAHYAAAELLTKPYLRIHEDPENNQSFKLVGSVRPFEGVSLGVLPYDRNCIPTDRAQFVQIKESTGHGDDVNGDKMHLSDGTHDGSDKHTSETCCANLSNVSLAKGAVPADKRGFCETQMSALAYSGDISELVNMIRALSCRVKGICGSSLQVLSDTGILDMALSDTQMEKRKLIIWMNSVALRCELHVAGVLVACGEGDTDEQAREVAHSAAVDLLCKPYLQIQENPESRHCYKLVGSDKAFTALLSTVIPCKQNFVVTNRMHDGGKLTQQHLGTHPPRSLTEFVILRNHVKKENTMDILKQSADFNNWPIRYDLTEVEGGIHCRVTLGGHTLGDSVKQKMKSAKKVAAEQALNRLTSTCYTVRPKKFNILANALTRREVCIVSVVYVYVFIHHIWKIIWFIVYCR